MLSPNTRLEHKTEIMQKGEWFFFSSQDQTSDVLSVSDCFLYPCECSFCERGCRGHSRAWMRAEQRSSNSWVKRQKGVETSILIFCKRPSNSVSPVSSFSIVPKRHKVIPSWSGGTLFKLWRVMRCQAVERHVPYFSVWATSFPFFISLYALFLVSGPITD